MVNFHQLSAADQDIVKTFDKAFNYLKDEQLILYGIGEKTKILIENLPDYNFVALVDKSSAGYQLHGINVLSIEQAISLSKHIIIVANYSSAHIIYRRIAHLQKEADASIYHMNGETLSYEIPIEKKKLNFSSKKELQAKILKNDVISFDFFETLACRKVMYPSDIFQLVQHRIKQEMDLELDFVATRIEAEKEVQEKYKKNTTIFHIYSLLEQKLKWSNKVCSKIMNWEIDIEKTMLSPRNEIVDFLKLSLRQNKHVIITSDMYFPKEIMNIFVRKIGIDQSIDLYISCDLGKSKYHGDIWQYYQTIFPNQTLLHIGDDDFSDIEQAKKYSFETFKVYSVMEMYQASRFSSQLSDKFSDFQDNILLGTFLAYFFADPFCLDNKQQIRRIDSIFDIGYLFYGPLIYYYMIWLVQLRQSQQINKILFISRDGYILKRLYETLLKKDHLQGLYFYASRRALAVSSIREEADIVDVFNIFFLSRNLSVDRFLHAAYGIAINQNDTFKGKLLFNLDKSELLTHILKNYKEVILSQSSREREEYLNYIESLQLSAHDKFAVINFVSNGVTQHFFEKLLPDFDLNFFYFLTKIEMKNTPIDLNKVQALYGNFLSSYTEGKSSLIKHFLTAEAVFSSPDEQFLKFKNRDPVFNSHDHERDFTDMSLCHDGIVAFSQDMFAIAASSSFKVANVALVDEIFGLMFDEKVVEVSENVKDTFSIDDDYATDRKITGLW